MNLKTNWTKFLCDGLQWKARWQKLNERHNFKPASLLKKRLWRRCFPVYVAKFLRTLFFPEHQRTTASEGKIKKIQMKMINSFTKLLFAKFIGLSLTLHEETYVFLHYRFLIIIYECDKTFVKCLIEYDAKGQLPQN